MSTDGDRQLDAQTRTEVRQLVREELGSDSATRRDLLKAMGAGGLVALLVDAGLDESTAEAVAAASQNDADGDIGAPNARIDAFLDGFDANSGKVNGPLEADDIPVSSWSKWAIRNMAKDDAYFHKITPGGEITSVSVTGGGKARRVSGNFQTYTPNSGDISELSVSTAHISHFSWDDANFYFHIPRANPSKTNTSPGDLIYHTFNRVQNDQAGFGLKHEAGTLYGVVHDGTSETTVELDASPSGTWPTVDHAYMSFDGNSVDFELGATTESITSGLPSGSIPNTNGRRAYHQYQENTGNSSMNMWQPTAYIGVVPK